MEVYTGKSVFGGIAIGRILVYGKGGKQVKRERTQDPEAEMSRCRKATETALEQLAGLYEKALQEVGEAHLQRLLRHRRGRREHYGAHWCRRGPGGGCSLKYR